MIGNHENRVSYLECVSITSFFIILFCGSVYPNEKLCQKNQDYVIRWLKLQLGNSTEFQCLDCCIKVGIPDIQKTG